MKIDIDAIMADSFKEAEKELKRVATNKFKERLGDKLRVVFADREFQQRLKDSVVLCRNNGILQNDTDIGYCYNLIETTITECVLGDRYKAFIENYIDTQYESHLKAALDKAMDHVAKKEAFTILKKE